MFKRQVYVIKSSVIVTSKLKSSMSQKVLTYKGKAIRRARDFSTETWQARREWHDMFNVLNGKNLHPGKYPARLSFRIEGEILSQTDKS